jgi:glutamate carboxypeptidase
MPPMRSLSRELHIQQAAMVRLLGRMVRCESPSFDKGAVDRFGRLVAAEWRKRGAQVEFLRRRLRGNHLRVTLWLGRGLPAGARLGRAQAGRPRGQILVLGHLDTVYALGTLERMPFRVARGRACGPAALDMKSGLVIALFAVDALRRTAVPGRSRAGLGGWGWRKRIVLLFTTDEEIGSQSSRRLIESEARRSDAVLVVEPASGLDGRLKTARKGVGEVELRVTGRAAHAGINPQDGVNAVHELAIQIARILRFNDPSRGITVNVNVAEGGTRSNVIAERARALVDLRITRAEDGPRLERKLRALRPALEGAQLEVRGGINRPPMKRTPAVAALFRQAARLGVEMGLKLKESSTGGGSDGNFTAALGIPTLDGLGGVGAGAHSPGEFVMVRALPERAALVAGLLASLSIFRQG